MEIRFKYILFALLSSLMLPNTSAGQNYSKEIQRFVIVNDSLSKFIGDYKNLLVKSQNKLQSNLILLSIDSLESCLIFQLEYYESPNIRTHEIYGLIQIEEFTIIILKLKDFQEDYFFLRKGLLSFTIPKLQNMRHIEEDSQYTTQLFVCAKDGIFNYGRK